MPILILNRENNELVVVRDTGPMVRVSLTFTPCSALTSSKPGMGA